MRSSLCEAGHALKYVTDYSPFSSSSRAWLFNHLNLKFGLCCPLLLEGCSRLPATESKTDCEHSLFCMPPLLFKGFNSKGRFKKMETRARLSQKSRPIALIIYFALRGMKFVGGESPGWPWCTSKLGIKAHFYTRARAWSCNFREIDIRSWQRFIRSSNYWELH